MMLNGHLEVDHTRPEMVKEVDPSLNLSFDGGFGDQGEQWAADI